MVYKAYLSHHGTKGQKWGVQNGPPYPLNDTVKAIAFRGGRRKDGTYIENLTDKDVRKARRLVDKHINTMTEEEIREYKDRLMMEKDMGIFMHPKSTKLKENLADAATDMVSNSVRNAGTKILTNIEVNAIGAIVGKVFGDQAAAMITDGVTKYQAEQNKRKKETEDREYQLRKEQQDNFKTQSDRNYDLQRDQFDRNKIVSDRDFDFNKQKYDDERHDKDEQIKRDDRDYQDKQDQKKYDRMRDTIKDQQTDFKNQTDRNKADNEAYKAKTERMKEENLHEEAKNGWTRSSDGDNKKGKNNKGKNNNK